MATARRAKGPCRSNDHEQGRFTFHLLDVIDPDRLRSDSFVHFSARDTGLISNDPLTKDWSMPFVDTDGPQRMIGTAGRYYIEVRWG